MIEHLLLKQLREDEEISGMLTRYRGETAVFYQNSPTDVDSGWEGSCFPRFEYYVDRSRDPEGQIAGKIYISIKTTSRDLSPSGGNLEREIELLLVNRISGAFYTSESGEVYGAEWVRSDAWVKSYNDRSNEAGVVELYGVDMEFDLVAFPSQISTNPDPVLGAVCGMKEVFPQIVVIGRDEIPSVWKPSAQESACYWRFVGFEGDMRQTYSVNWYTGILGFHVFSETVGERNRWVKAVAEWLQVVGEIVLLDESPMFVQKVTVIHDGDPLREGQLKVTGEYGVLASLRKERGCLPLERVEFSEMRIEKKE